jgi:hypothetical protein
MSDQITAPVILPNGIVLRHAHGPENLTACFPVISQLRPRLKGVVEWVGRRLRRCAPPARLPLD